MAAGCLPCRGLSQPCTAPCPQAPPVPALVPMPRLQLSLLAPELLSIAWPHSLRLEQEGQRFPCPKPSLGIQHGAGTRSSASQHGHAPLRLLRAAPRLCWPSVPTPRGLAPRPSSLTFLTEAAFLGQVGAGSPISGRTGSVCALGETGPLAAGPAGERSRTVGAGERGRAAACCPLLPLSPLPSQGFELWRCLPAEKGVKRCQREAGMEKGERLRQVVLS